VALFLIVRRTVRRKFIRRSDEKLLEIGGVTFRQLLISVSGCLSLTQYVTPSKLTSGPTPPLLRSLIIQYFGILLSGSGGVRLMDQANRPKVV
jgi:hypothetical protein